MQNVAPSCGTAVENGFGPVFRSGIRIEIEGGCIDAGNPLTGFLFDLTDGIIQMRRERSHDRIDAVFQEHTQHGNNAFTGLVFLDEIVLGETGVRPAQEPIRSHQQTRQTHATDNRARKFILVGHTSSPEP